MDRYQGDLGDKIKGGGSFVKKFGFGAEIFNFADVEGKTYGYVRPPGGKAGQRSPNLNLKKLGAPRGAESIENVLCVWVANRLEIKKQVVVGLYRNAKVYSRAQKGPVDSIRYHDDEPLEYYVEVASRDALLLPKDRRLIVVPQGKDWMGQANIWYGKEIDEASELGKLLENFLTFGEIPPVSSTSPPRQTDPLLRQKVEKIAIQTTWGHFESIGFAVSTVEKDNVGWDLEANHDKLKLLLEVKGLSGTEVSVELTPNEFKQMQKNNTNYRLCVVTNTLKEPKLHVFSYVPEVGAWETEDRLRLKIERVESARCRVE